MYTLLLFENKCSHIVKLLYRKVINVTNMLVFSEKYWPVVLQYNGFRIDVIEKYRIMFFILIRITLWLK